MQVTAALLCDAASVREGLLFVMGGGITRLWRQDFPAPFGCALALMLEIHQAEMHRPHEIDVLIQGADGESIAQAKGGFQTADADLGVGEKLLVPFALPLHAALLPKPNRYSIEIVVDRMHQRTIEFQARLASEASEPGPLHLASLRWLRLLSVAASPQRRIRTVSTRRLR